MNRLAGVPDTLARRSSLLVLRTRPAKKGMKSSAGSGKLSYVGEKSVGLVFVKNKLEGARLMRRLCAIIVAVSILLMMGCFGKKKGGEKVIAVVPKSQAHIFWQTVHAGAIAAGEDFGVKILWKAPTTETDYAEQVRIVEDFITQRVDGIVLAPTERKGLVPYIERAARTIPLTIFDSGAATEQYVSFVATDNYQGGVMGAERMAKILSGKGKLVVIKVIPGSASTTARENGFQDTIKKKYSQQMKIVDSRYGMSDRAKSLAVAEDLLTAYPDLDGIFAANEPGAVGALEAVKARGLAGKVKIVGFDSSPSLEQGVRDGTLDSLVVQDPFNIGYQAVETIADKLNGKTPPKRIPTKATLITRDNIDTEEIQRLLNPDIEKYLKK